MTSCIAFHSSKGGVGRTLALANCANALTISGYKVLIIDCDVIAPGVPDKFNIKPPHTGLVEYYRDFSIEQRATDKTQDAILWAVKKKFIDDKLTFTDNSGLAILEAGRHTRVDYWNMLSSHQYNRLFYFFPEQLNAYPPEQLESSIAELNRIAFKNDINLFIEAAENPDFVLIDTKGNEDQGLSCTLWADKLIHFFPPNNEGINFLNLTSSTLKGLALSGIIEHQIELIPVITRIPENNFDDTVKKIVSQLEGKNNGSSPFTEKDFRILPEERVLETQECLIINQKNKEYHILPLAHRYVELLASFASPKHASDSSEDYKKFGLLNQATYEWHVVLGIDTFNKHSEQIFIKHQSEGRMINSDGEPNIALRVKTLHLILNEIISNLLPNNTESNEKQEREVIENALTKGGFASGNDFGEELQTKFFTKFPERFDTEYKKLKFWSEFDSGTGFGKIEPIYDESQELSDNLAKNGYIIVKNSSFAKDPRISQDTFIDIQSIFQGYTQAVLEKIFNTSLKSEDRLSVIVNKLEYRDWSNVDDLQQKINDQTIDKTSLVYKFTNSSN